MQVGLPGSKEGHLEKEKYTNKVKAKETIDHHPQQ